MCTKYLSFRGELPAVAEWKHDVGVIEAGNGVYVLEAECVPNLVYQQLIARVTSHGYLSAEIRPSVCSIAIHGVHPVYVELVVYEADIIPQFCPGCRIQVAVRERVMSGASGSAVASRI